MRTMLFALCVLLPTIAFAQTAEVQIIRQNPSELPKPTGYAQVVEVTGAVKTIYVAGQVAADRDGKLIGAGNMEEQAEQVYKNVEAALTAAGASFKDVVKMNTYVTDIAHLDVVREVREKYLRSALPASTLVQVAALARPEYLIEVEVIAVMSR